MSFSSVGGGFQGGDALLAFAAIQQGRMNDEMSDAMQTADLRSQMAGDLSNIKSHLEQANRYPEKFPAMDQELQAFMEKYGQRPELEDVTSVVREIADNLNGRLETARAAPGIVTSSSHRGGGGAVYQAGGESVISEYKDETIKDWLDNLTGALDASGTNDQLNMIHIKQLNDNIDNSSGVVSGIITSRQNAMASIINNIA